jgi:PAS domain S-box-containing protein
MSDESTPKCSILIVEDEPIVAKDLQQTLRDMNYDAYAIASSADDAIRRATERCPDLVLMDIRIKGARDGIETADLLRQQFGVSVVYLTAHADAATIERAAKTAPYGYLLKPIKAAELRSAVEVAAFRQKLDRAVRERERSFSTALNTVNDAVVAVDLAGKVTYLNAAAESLIGATSAQTIGKSAEQVMEVMHRASGASAASAPEPSRPDAPHPPDTAAAMRLPLREGVTQIIEDGHLRGAVMVFRDVREKDRLQKQLELTDRLASLGTMAAGTAHELNNPLTVVVTNAGFLAEEILQLQTSLGASSMRDMSEQHFKRINEALGDVQAAASRMTRIVADLRTFSRPLEHESRTIDLRRCIEWAVRTTAHEFQTRAQLRTRFDPAPTVLGDAARLEQVLVNLLINAAHSIAPGRAERNEVRVSLRTNESGWAVVEVSDTGEGIRADVLEKIFEPFFTTKGASKGTGLGLSICHGIVKSLGGDIRVRSEPAEGTTFSVALPPAPRAQELAPGQQLVIEPISRRGRILVIDDESALLRAMQRILEDEGHTVTATVSAMDALAMIERGDHFELIISDLMMPMMTGIDFYQTLLARNPTLANAVIFVSGGAITAKADAFLKSVENLRLEKPFKAPQLRDVVQRVLAEQNSQQGSQPGAQAGRPGPGVILS